MLGAVLAVPGFGPTAGIEMTLTDSAIRSAEPGPNPYRPTGHERTFILSWMKWGLTISPAAEYFFTFFGGLNPPDGPEWAGRYLFV